MRASQTRVPAAATLAAGLATVLAGCGLGSASGTDDPTPSPRSTAAIATPPDAGVELQLMSWEDRGDAAEATLRLRNISSQWTYFVVDVAATDPDGRRTAGYGTVFSKELTPGASADLATTVDAPIPEGSVLGVANLWGRAPGDPQLHPIPIGVRDVFMQSPAPNASSPTAGAPTAGAPTAGSPTASTPTTAGGAGTAATGSSAAGTWTTAQVMAAAEAFATELSEREQACRQAGDDEAQVCLSRRNAPDYLLAEPARSQLTLTPYYVDAGRRFDRPRAFELAAPSGEAACVGWRIDKQTPEQAVIAGPCTQRGFIAGDPRPVGAIGATTVTATVRPTAAPSPTASPSAASPSPSPKPRPAASEPPSLGTPVRVGDLEFTATGVQIDLSALAPAAAPKGEYTLVEVQVRNLGTAAAKVDPAAFAGTDTTGATRSPDAAASAALNGRPQIDLAPGATARLALVFDLPPDSTLGRLAPPGAGGPQTIDLLPSPT